MKMFNKKAFKITLIFLVVYSIVQVIGAPFLVTWGGTTVFKEVIMFFLSIPFNWSDLISSNLGFLLLNILFWSLVVYVILLIVLNVVIQTRRQNQ